jgi:hypothetical protein
MFVLHQPYLTYMISAYVIAALVVLKGARRHYLMTLMEHADRDYTAGQWRALKFSSVLGLGMGWLVWSIGSGTVLGYVVCTLVWLIRR